jgi:hypothetical protein
MADTIRSDELADALVEGLTNGVPLRQLCREHEVSKSAVYDWIDDDEAFAGRIARARARGYDQLAEEILEIADDTSNDTIETDSGEIPNKEWIMRSKLRAEMRLKLLSKWDPKRYGERLALAGDKDAPVHIHVSNEDAGL